VEYIGLGVVVSMLMAAVASVIDSAAGERLANAIVSKLLEQITSAG
jgi:hypothetical protein